MSASEQQLKTSVRDCLAQLKISRGDTVFLHSDAIVVAQFPGLQTEQRIHCLLDAIEEFLGAEGTLVLPTFTYSFTKNEVFDVRLTPSTVGMITEIFRKRPGVARNTDPIFSVAASGFAKDEFARSNSAECFGKDSSFGLLHRKNAWLAGFGCGFAATYVHYVEKCFGVDYRFEKLFRGTLIDSNGSRSDATVSYYVRQLERKTNSNYAPIQKSLERHQLFHATSLGRVRAWAVRAGDFRDHALALLQGNPLALIEEGLQLAS